MPDNDEKDIGPEYERLEDVLKEEELKGVVESNFGGQTREDLEKQLDEIVFRVPVFMSSKDNQMGWAYVDKKFAHWISQYKFFSARAEMYKVPRTQVSWLRHKEEAGKYILFDDSNNCGIARRTGLFVLEAYWLQLNRIIAAFDGRTPEELDTFLKKPWLLHEAIKQIPRISFKNKRQMDCRLINMNIWLSRSMDEQAKKRKQERFPVKYGLLTTEEIESMLLTNRHERVDFGPAHRVSSSKVDAIMNTPMPMKEQEDLNALALAQQEANLKGIPLTKHLAEQDAEFKKKQDEIIRKMKEDPSEYMDTFETLPDGSVVEHKRKPADEESPKVDTTNGGNT